MRPKCVMQFIQVWLQQFAGKWVFQKCFITGQIHAQLGSHCIHFCSTAHDTSLVGSTNNNRNVSSPFFTWNNVVWWKLRRLGFSGHCNSITHLESDIWLEKICFWDWIYWRTEKSPSSGKNGLNLKIWQCTVGQKKTKNPYNTKLAKEV